MKMAEVDGLRVTPDQRVATELDPTYIAKLLVIKEFRELLTDFYVAFGPGSKLFPGDGRSHTKIDFSGLDIWHLIGKCQSHLPRLKHLITAVTRDNVDGLPEVQQYKKAVGTLQEQVADMALECRATNEESNHPRNRAANLKEWPDQMAKPQHSDTNLSNHLQELKGIFGNTQNTATQVKAAPPSFLARIVKCLTRWFKST